MEKDFNITVTLTKAEVRACINRFVALDRNEAEESFFEKLMEGLYNAVNANEEQPKAEEKEEPAETPKNGLTINEHNVLKYVSKGNFFNETIDDNPNELYATDDIAEFCGITMRAVRGVVTSLVKKGYLTVEEDPDCECNWLFINKKGVQYIKDNFR